MGPLNKKNIKYIKNEKEDTIAWDKILKAAQKVAQKVKFSTSNYIVVNSNIASIYGTLK